MVLGLSSLPCSPLPARGGYSRGGGLGAHRAHRRGKGQAHGRSRDSTRDSRPRGGGLPAPGRLAFAERGEERGEQEERGEERREPEERGEQGREGTGHEGETGRNAKATGPRAGAHRRGGLGPRRRGGAQLLRAHRRDCSPAHGCFKCGDVYSG